MLCYGAVLRSEKASVEELGTIFEKLVEISSKRSYLSVAAIKFLVDYLPKIDENDFAEKIWPLIQDKCRWRGSEAKIENMWLLLEIHEKFPAIPNKGDLQVHFQRKKLLTEDLGKEIAEILSPGENIKFFYHSDFM